MKTAKSLKAAGDKAIKTVGNAISQPFQTSRGSSKIEYKKYVNERGILYALLFGAFLGAFIVTMTGYDFSYNTTPLGCVTNNGNRTAAYAKNSVVYPANNATSTCGNYMCVTMVSNVVFANLSAYVLAVLVIGWVMYGAGASYMFYLSSQSDLVDDANSYYQNLVEARKYDLLTTIYANISVPLLCVPLIFYLGENTVFVSYVFPVAIFLSLFIYSLADVQEYDHAMYVVRVMFHMETDEDDEIDYLVDESKQYSKHQKKISSSDDSKNKLYKWMYLCVKFVIPLLVFGLLVSAISVSFTQDVNWSTSSAGVSYNTAFACFLSVMSLMMLYHILKTVFGVFSKTGGDGVSMLIRGMTYVFTIGVAALIITIAINLQYVNQNACKFLHN